LEEMGKREIKAFGSIGLAGVWVSSQHKGLRHITKRSFGALRLDLSSAAEVTSPDPRSETEEKLLLDRF
jgi:hypothetical protein